MISKNSLIKAIAVICVLTLTALTVLPGCNFIGQADVSDETTTLADAGYQQCCPICQSVNISGPDAEGFYTCNDCSAKWAQDETKIDVVDPDNGEVITQLNPSAGLRPNNQGSAGGSGNGGNGGSAGTTRPTTTTTTKNLQQQLDEIKDRWGDVINPTIDADGNITVESVDGTDTGLFGFKYSTRDKCFIIAEDAWQRNFGYNQTYDDTSAAIAITYDTMRVYFTYDGLEWMIQYWKGQYGLVLVGAEVGTYNRPVGSSASSHYDCADDELKMLQSMDVYRRESSTSSKYNKIFSRSPAYTWWCAGFIPGTLGAGKYNVSAQETAMLRVDSKLTLHSPEMAQAFMQGLREVSKVEYNGISRQIRNIDMTEYATVAEYEAATGVSHKFCLEEDGVTVRVCWR